MKRQWLVMTAAAVLGFVVVGVWMWLRPSPRPLLAAQELPIVRTIEELGGMVSYEEDDPEEGVVAVNLTGMDPSEKCLESLKELTRLRRLHLNGTQITDGQLAHLEAADSLQELYLSATPITDAGLKHLGQLTELEHLDLSATRITDLGLVHLRTLTRLETLDLVGTAVTPGGVQTLSQALPDLKIRWTTY
jgi:hypothetical protein